MPQVTRFANFNPRPPRGGRRSNQLHAVLVPGVFQSTPPARGATDERDNMVLPGSISIHAPREGGDDHDGGVGVAQIVISIHAPREGGDVQLLDVGVDAAISIHAPREGGDSGAFPFYNFHYISIHAPREGGDSKDAQFYLRIFDKQVELLRFLGIIRGGCLRNPEKDRRFLGKSLANLPEISGHLDFAGGGKARPGYPCAVPLPRRAACVRGSGDPPADRCSSYRNAPLFSHIASLDSKSADCLSQNP